MERRILIVYVSLFFLLIARGVFAEEGGYTVPAANPMPAVDSRDVNFQKNPLNKLARGLTNIAFFWLEVPAGMKETAAENNNEFVGFSLGFVKGVFTAFLRVLTATFDTATFIVPSYDKPLMEPEYVFSRFD